MTMRRCTSCGYFTHVMPRCSEIIPPGARAADGGPVGRRSMKFGKHLKTVAVEGGEYLDYKQLKQLLKRLQSMGEAGEKQFM